MPSRGGIIAGLLGSRTLDEAARAVICLDPIAYAPWRLLVIDGSEMVDARPRGRQVRLRRAGLPSRAMRTSSSAEFARAARVRHRLFRALVDTADDARQDAFHDHQWPEALEVSVRMSRADAATVSRTRVELFDDRVELTYEPLHSADDGAAPSRRPHAMVLRLSGAA